MKKKLALTLGFVSTAASAANGVTVPANLAVGMALDQQLSVVVEIDKNYHGIVGNDGIAFDYITKRGAFQQNIPITWYAGVGGWYDWDNELGLRVPLGVDWNMSKGWHAYVQLHPELELYKDLDLKLGAAIGIKYNF